MIGEYLEMNDFVEDQLPSQILHLTELNGI